MNKLEQNSSLQMEEITIVNLVKLFLKKKVLAFRIFFSTFAILVGILGFNIFKENQSESAGQVHKKIRFTTIFEVGHTLNMALVPLQTVKYYILEVYSQESGFNQPIVVDFDREKMGNVMTIVSELDETNLGLKPSVLSQHKYIIDKVLETHNERYLKLNSARRVLLPNETQNYPTELIRFAQEKEIREELIGNSPKVFGIKKIIGFGFIIFFVSTFVSILFIVIQEFIYNLKKEIQKA